jgi:hypothetical protein
MIWTKIKAFVLDLFAAMANWFQQLATSCSRKKKQTPPAPSRPPVEKTTLPVSLPADVAIASLRGSFTLSGKNPQQTEILTQRVNAPSLPSSHDKWKLEFTKRLESCADLLKMRGAGIGCDRYINSLEEYCQNLCPADRFEVTLMLIQMCNELKQQVIRSAYVQRPTDRRIDNQVSEIFKITFAKTIARIVPKLDFSALQSWWKAAVALLDNEVADVFAHEFWKELLDALVENKAIPPSTLFSYLDLLENGESRELLLGEILTRLQSDPHLSPDDLENYRHLYVDHPRLEAQLVALTEGLVALTEQHATVKKLCLEARKVIAAQFIVIEDLLNGRASITRDAVFQLQSALCNIEQALNYKQFASLKPWIENLKEKVDTMEGAGGTAAKDELLPLFACFKSTAEPLTS